MPKIVGLEGKIIKDSRGDETVGAVLRLKSGEVVSSSVPRGKSTGSYEAVSLPAEAARSSIERAIAPAIVGRDARECERIDKFLIELDGTEKKEKLGANAILAVSIAVSRAAAEMERVPLWRHIRTRGGFDAPRDYTPLFLVNLINGGAHAENNLSFQEYIVIPEAKEAKESARAARELHGALREYFKERGIDAPYGDEGGFAPDLADDKEPFAVLSEIAGKMEMKFRFGLDAAANEVRKKEWELTPLYRAVIKEYRLAYLEDPYGEDDFASFARLLRSVNGVSVVGDDLTAANPRRIERAKRERSVNGIIVKPNQIGTVSETLEVIKAAKSWGWGVFVSHRSGETRDDFIADLAYGCAADGIKLGAPLQEERLTKYARLCEIEENEV